MWKPFVDLGSYRSELANANFILECILNPLHTLKILRLALNSSDERSGRNVIQSQPKLECGAIVLTAVLCGRIGRARACHVAHIAAPRGRIRFTTRWCQACPHALLL